MKHWTLKLHCRHRRLLHATFANEEPFRPRETAAPAIITRVHLVFVPFAVDAPPLLLSEALLLVLVLVLLILGGKKD